MMNEHIFYTYVYLDTRKSQGNYVYEKDGNKFEFEYPPFYIGKGKNKQIDSHLKESFKWSSNRLKLNMINNIKRETSNNPVRFKYKENLTEQEAFNLERIMIKTIGRRDKEEGPLTNLTDGGEGPSGFIHSIETRKKISIATSGSNNPMYGKTGEENPNYGKNISIETRNKISVANKGKTRTLESRIKMSNAQKGEKHHNYGKRGFGTSMYGRKGKDSPRYGIIVSDSTRNKMSEARKGKYYGSNNPNAKTVIINYIKYNSISEAANDINVNRDTITRRIKRGMDGYSF